MSKLVSAGTEKIFPSNYYLEIIRFTVLRTWTSNMDFI